MAEVKGWARGFERNVTRLEAEVTVWAHLTASLWDPGQRVWPTAAEGRHEGAAAPGPGSVCERV